MLQLSLDGVQESRSSSVSIDVYSISFHNCSKVYPIRLIRPTNRYKYDEQNQILAVIKDILGNSCIITAGIFDNPKRSIVRCALCHSSTYACEYCESKAVLVMDLLVIAQKQAIKKKYEIRKKNIQNTIDFLKESPGSVASKDRDNKKIEELYSILETLGKQEEDEIKVINKKKKLCWPFSTMCGLLRTNDLIRYIVNKIEREQVLDKHEKKGFKGVSHFLKLENFNFIQSLPAEYMHSLCIGVGKRLLVLTFDLGEKRTKTSKRKLSDCSKFNSLIKAIQVVREFSRRCRNLDLGIIKAQEYRNLILFFFPLIIECIEEEYSKEKMIWLHFAYFVRACVLPNAEFDCIDPSDIKRSCTKFYSLFEKCFGEENCSYSVHIVTSHVLKIRGENPLTETSAFKYENFYSEMKHLFHPGSTNPLKQILQNTIMKRSLENHSCYKPIKYTPVKTPNKGMENNSLVYIFNEHKEYDFYNIIQINEDKTYQCTPQGRFEFNCPLTPEINWSSVGVFKAGPTGNTVNQFKKSDFHGKAIKVDNFLITCPINVLREQ